MLLESGDVGFGGEEVVLVGSRRGDIDGFELKAVKFLRFVGGLIRTYDVIRGAFWSRIACFLLYSFFHVPRLVLSSVVPYVGVFPVVGGPLEVVDVIGAFVIIGAASFHM